MEVPEMELVPPLFQVEIMLEPMIQVRWLSEPSEGAVRTRSPDVDERTEVGVGGLGVSDGGGTDCDDRGGTGRGVVGGVVIAVPCRNDGGDTR